MGLQMGNLLMTLHSSKLDEISLFVKTKQLNVVTQMFIDIHTARGFCLPLKNEVFYDLNIKPWISKPEIDLEIRYKTMFDREVKQLLS